MDFSETQNGEYVVLGGLSVLYLSGSLAGLTLSESPLTWSLGVFTLLPVLVLQWTGIAFPFAAPLLAFTIPAVLFATYRRAFGDVFFFLSFGSMLALFLGV